MPNKSLNNSSEPESEFFINAIACSASAEASTSDVPGVPGVPMK